MSIFQQLKIEQIIKIFIYSRSLEMQVQQSSILNDSLKYKVVFLGESAVGKTSLVQYLAHGTFNQIFDPTLYLDSVRKNFTYQGKSYKFMFWDTAGQEKFNSLVPSAIRGSQCAIVVFDVSDRTSFEKCQNWIKILRNSVNLSECPAILVGNKNDLQRIVSKMDAFDFAVANKMTYIETSAKTGAGVQNIISQIIESVESKNEKSTKSSQQISDRKMIKVSNIKISQPQIKLKKSSNWCCSI